MIYTLTLNPALDFFIRVNNFTVGKLNLSHESYYRSGGKGINVSKVLKHFNVNSIVLGYVGGFSGNEVINDLSSRDIPNQLIKVSEPTRVNVKLFDTKHEIETDINNSNLTVSESELQQLLNFIKNNITENDILVCSGSIPKGLPSNIYKIIAQNLPINTKVFLDTRGNSLLENLYNNFLIKPNISELKESLNKDLDNIENIIESTQIFLDKGIKNILVSLGSKGAILINKECIFHALPIKVNTKNTVGAGDSLVAGFIVGMCKNYDIKDCFKLGVATATATVSTNEKNRYKILPDILNKINIEKIYNI